MRPSITGLLASLLGLGSGMRVVSTDRDRTLARDGYAEIRSSSVAGLEEFSICLRFLTFTFSVQWSDWPIVASMGRGTLFARYGHFVLSFH